MSNFIKFGAVALLAITSIFGATAAHAATVSNPDGVLLKTQVVTIEPGALELDLANSAGWFGSRVLASGEYYGILAANDLCNVKNQLHAYNTVDITVERAGNYTFRIVDGTGDLLGTDPYLAVFKDFNPAEIDPGVIGCNDDQNSTGLGWVSGDTIPGYGAGEYDEHFSWFSVDLIPGNYTVMLTSWAGVPAAEWDTTESSTFEFWGPDCGIVGAQCAPVETPAKTLAATGVEASSSLLAGLGVLAAGVAAVAVRRRLVK
jgi:LPXTG-motif cell wall-anchored protein